MRSIKHITPRYIADRIAVATDERWRPERPWLTKVAVDILDNLLRPSDFVVETGSGRSTIWFAERCRHMLSLEHHHQWYQDVIRMNETNVYWSKVDYRMCPTPESYVGAITELEKSSVDFILIDGQERGRCALAGLPKVAKGGIIAVDNVNWFLPSNSRSPNSRSIQEGCESLEWEEFAGQVDRYRRIWTTNGVSDTCLWFVI